MNSGNAFFSERRAVVTAMNVVRFDAGFALNTLTAGAQPSRISCTVATSRGIHLLHNTRGPSRLV